MTSVLKFASVCWHNDRVLTAFCAFYMFVAIPWCFYNIYRNQWRAYRNVLKEIRRAEDRNGPMPIKENNTERDICIFCGQTTCWHLSKMDKST